MDQGHRRNVYASILNDSALDISQPRGAQLAVLDRWAGVAYRDG